jgi:predicted nucleic acid-binding protein
MARLVAVLDANVLYPARLRDLLLRLAIAGMFQPRWTAPILAECFDSLLADRPDLTAEQLDRTRHLMAVAVPDALVEGYEDLIGQLELPDSDDRHVLAAAIAAGADLLVTWNLADFPPAATRGLRLSVVTPDDLVLRLVQADVEVVVAVVDAQAAGLRRPPMTTAELLHGLESVGLTASVAALRARMEL